MGLLNFLNNLFSNDMEKKYDALMDKAYNPEIKDDDISQLDENEKIFYVLYYFNAEWQNGGLCQFFVNSSKRYAPLISEYLEIVGALEHKKIFDNFIKDNNINLYDLSFFTHDENTEYQDLCNAYPFDEFDDAFYDLGELDDYLEAFMKAKNI